MRCVLLQQGSTLSLFWMEGILVTILRHKLFRNQSVMLALHLSVQHCTFWPRWFSKASTCSCYVGCEFNPDVVLKNQALASAACTLPPDPASLQPVPADRGVPQRDRQESTISSTVASPGGGDVTILRHVSFQNQSMLKYYVSVGPFGSTLWLLA